MQYRLSVVNLSVDTIFWHVYEDVKFAAGKNWPKLKQGRAEKMYWAYGPTMHRSHGS